MKEIRVQIRPGDEAAFRNRTRYCVGTGRMGLALHREYQEQLRSVQEKCAFEHIRGHGLFSDDMGIYQKRRDPDGETRVQYCYTYLDRVMDSYREAGLKPFLELGFMPEKMASGTQTIFYWKGHVTPPADMKDWTDLVQATLTHLCKRYGKDEVATWPLEVWNEPNLRGFWENADKPKYLELFEATFRAVKEVLPGARVGGPAICGGEGSQGWIRDFLAFCSEKKLACDFVTRHAYMGETPEHRGRYLYHPMREVDDLIAEMRESRDIIDSFPEFRGIPMYITEFNTSYNPFCPIHDTVYNAAVCAALLSRLGDVAEGYSYWTFGDVFEEGGVPVRPFHGGFGLEAAGCIAKPTLWSFAFFAGLDGKCVYRDEHAVLTLREDGAYEGVAWNLAKDGDTRLVWTVPASGKTAALVTETVADGVGDPLKIWHDLGEPACLDRETERILRAAAAPRTDTAPLSAENGSLTAELTLTGNSVVHFILKPTAPETDPGYDYHYYCDEVKHG